MLWREKRIMTGRDRVWAALRGSATDRPARGEIFISPELIKKFGCADQESILACLRADLAVLPVEDPHSARPFIEAGYFVFGLVQGPLTLLIHELGWHGASRLLLKKPDDARRIMQKFADAAVRKMKLALKARCDGIVVADDLADSRGPMVSPALLSECYFPVLSKLVKETGADNNHHISLRRQHHRFHSPYHGCRVSGHPRTSALRRNRPRNVCEGRLKKPGFLGQF